MSALALLRILPAVSDDGTSEKERIVGNIQSPADDRRPPVEAGSE
jgi:hypothetical protein